MEDIDITSSESSEMGVASPESIREKSEKQKEAYKKAQAQIQRAKKDEKKATGDNNELFLILSRFIQNPYYEILIPRITDLLSITLPSRSIIGLLALIYPDAAHHVFQTIGHSERIHLMQKLHHYENIWDFHESELHPSLREWMTIWVDSFDKYIAMEASSIVMQKKFLVLIDESESLILASISDCVGFFFSMRNIRIATSTIDAYSRFILGNIRKTLQKSIFSHPDSDMVVDTDIVDMTLFGF